MKTEIPAGYTRVTEPLSVFAKLDQIDPDVLRYAADRGTRTHTFCELYVLNLLIEEVDKDCKPYFDSFVEWYDSMCKELVMTETRINSPKHLLSGCFDMLLYIKGDSKPSILDIKTPQTASKTWALQTAAYKMMLEEEMQIEADRRVCLMLDKNGGRAKIVEYTNFETHKQMYLNCLQLHRYFK